MRRILGLAVIGSAVMLIAANFNISQFQAITEAALGTLELEAIPNTSGLIGGPATYKITEKTIEHLHKLQKANKHIVAHPDGTITIK